MFWKSKGILGINARNLLYIRPYNKKKAIKLADDKIRTKQFLSARDIPVPKMINIIRNHEELENFSFSSLPSSFVIKPNNGYGGEGIIVITEKKDQHWITSNGKKLDKDDLYDHIGDILDGRFSISNVSDSALFEQLIIADDVLGKYSYKGLPDIRVVVHNLIPVMAMVRLPSRESDGKANLHMGAIGVGIDIAKGEATYITYKDKIIDEIPDGAGTIRGLKIPYWDKILEISSRVQLITNLGYLAVDIALDKNNGPVLLEINARAGLRVQIANLAKLRKRLQRIEGVKVTSPIKGVRIAKDMFGNTVEKEIKHLSGKEVINIEENIEIIDKKGTHKICALVDTGKTRSVIDEDFAEKAGLLENEQNYDHEKGSLKVKFTLKEKRIQTIVDVENIPSDEHKFILANRDLSGFLINANPPKTGKTTMPTVEIKKEKKTTQPKGINYSKIDQQLIHIDSKIKLLYHLKPTNLEAEKEKFIKDNKYNPQFEYPALKFNPLSLIEELEKIKFDKSPTGKLFEAKKDEILKKIALLESIDEERFTRKSVKLFGEPSEDDVKKATEKLLSFNQSEIEKQKSTLNTEDAEKRFNQVFRDYGLDNWKVKVKENMVARCVAGKKNRMFIRAGSKFSEKDIKSLTVHEIETHIITAENGKKQNYELFNRGLANYLVTQEGLAMYNVDMQTDQAFKNNQGALGHVIAIDKAMRGSFSDVYHKLRKLGLPEHKAFISTLKSKRGTGDTSKPGAFTKDLIYFKGYHQVKNFIDGGGNIEDLYLGKYNIEDLELIKQLPGLNKPKILPTWLSK